VIELVGNEQHSRGIRGRICMNWFEQCGQHDQKHQSGEQFHENLGKKLASGAEYITARSRCSAKREDAAKTRKRRYK